MKQSMFEKLQCLPLLIGLSVNDLMDIVEKVKFEFNKYPEDFTIVSQGDKCDKLIYILSGELCVSKIDGNQSIYLYEYFNRPSYVIEPQNMWGMRQKYDRSYTFMSEGSTCVIEKKQVNYLMSKYDIIKTNFLNMICNKLQSSTNALTQQMPSNTEEKIIHFLKSNKVGFYGWTEIKAKMQQLANHITDTRLNVSKVLNKWQSKGMIEIRRGGIVIYDDMKLIDKQN